MMEAALVSGFINAILPKLLSLAEEKYKLHKSVRNDIRFLAKELRMIMGAIDDELSVETKDQGAVPRMSIEDLRELAHKIEDCIDSLLYRVAWKRHKSFLSRSVRYPKMLPSGHLKIAEEMQRLRKAAEETHQRKQRYTVAASMQETTSQSWPPLSDPRILDGDLIGVDGARAELLAEVNGQPKQLKVLAIVGFCGLGKTALAAQVYNTATGDGRFEKHAWVCAAHRPPAEVLTDMLRKLDADVGPSQGASDIGQLCVDLRNQLDNKRYFIVIDDIRTEDQWKSIKSAFPDNDITSRILVTTTIQSVANACTSADGYVHKVSRLDEECSKQLFSKKTCPEKYQRYKQPDSTEILKKCDGQPLALVTIGEFLKTKGWPTGPTCEDICNQLHYHLENERTFGAMRQVLMRNYTTLPGHALKSCLLYFGIFPSNHPIRIKSLLRRWLAEGFVESRSSHTTLDPANYVDVLMDRNIIEPINVSNNEKAKTCQTYGMMHDCILHMAIAQNFVTLFSDDKIEPRYVRRLCLHNSPITDEDNLDTIGFSLVRSLTVFGKASEAILDFSRCPLLRVLDLENCDDLNDDHLKKICSMLLLKYLSLGGNITQLPRDVAKLKDLEVFHFDKCSEDFLNALEGPCYLSSLKLYGQLSALPEFIISLRGLKELCLSSAKLPKGLLEALSKLSYLKYLKLIADDIEKIIIKDQAFSRLLRLCFVLQRPTFPILEEGSMPFLVTLQLFCKDLDGLSGIKMEYLRHLKEVFLDHRVAPDTMKEWERAAKKHPNKPKVLSTRSTDKAESELTEDSIASDLDRLESTEISVPSRGSVQEIDIQMLVNQELKSSAATKKQNNCAVQSSSDVYAASELAKTKSEKYSSNESVQETDTQMSNNQGLEYTISQRKQNNFAPQSNSIGELDSASQDMGISEDSPLTKFSETASTSESEHMDHSVALERVKVESLENTVALKESIRRTNTQIPVEQ